MLIYENDFFLNFYPSLNSASPPRTHTHTSACGPSDDGAGSIFGYRVQSGNSFERSSVNSNENENENVPQVPLGGGSLSLRKQWELSGSSLGEPKGRLGFALQAVSPGGENGWF